ncbi:Glutathione S-transferase theta-1 [Frankliniella fusca]|uniref:Glutathione S-transferase theta-1 n=1 Tax=Frankliniella fusca TaxID=407009 RepID=A0AAE1H0E3_9NEOP|nr:Glutathione S-transferase theta-1 [Frankliniella fusca]
MTLKYYFDLLSQPSRALKIFLSVTKIPHESCQVALRKGEHKQEPYLSVNRFGRVPAIDDDGFKLSESVAIVRYLSNKYSVPNNWYPKDVKGQAAVDEFLEWHHLDLRLGCAMYFQTRVLKPMLTGQPPSEKSLQMFTERMNTSLDNFENLWLGDGRPYLTGNQISAADIFAACEIEQVAFGGHDPTKGRPKLGVWLERVRKDLSPHYQEAHTFLEKFRTASSKL